MVWEEGAEQVSADSRCRQASLTQLWKALFGWKEEPEPFYASRLGCRPSVSKLVLWGLLGLLSFLFPAVAEGGGPRSFLSHAEPGRAGRGRNRKETLAPLSELMVSVC